MADRELLELAAFAAGIGPVLCYESNRNCLRIGDRQSYSLWRPLTDDGDALRLSLKLKINIKYTTDGYIHAGYSRECYVEEPLHWNLAADVATRRAITRAAAAIGEQKGKGL